MILIIAMEFHTRHTADPIELQRKKKSMIIFAITRDRMHITNLSKWKLSQMLKRTHANDTCSVRPVCAFAVAPRCKTYLMPCETDCVTTARPTDWLCCAALPLDTTKVGWFKLCDVMAMCFHFTSSFSMLLFSFTLRNSTKKWRVKTICPTTIFFLSFAFAK